MTRGRAIRLAVASTALTATPAWAEVTLYGRLHVGVDNYAASGASSADLKARFRVYDENSRLGIRLSEELGEGLRTIVQIESGVNIDSGDNTGQAGQTNVSSGFLASRDSFVGFDHRNLGRLTFGRQSIWWLNGRIIQVASTYAHAELPWVTGQMGRLSMGIIRNSDTVQYTTPALSGLNATLSWSPNAATGGAPFVNSESRQGGQYADARVIGVTLRWSTGPFAAQLDYGNKRTASDAVPGRWPRNTGWKVLAGWTYAPESQIAAIVIHMKNADVNATTGLAAAGDSLTQIGYGLAWEHRLAARVQLLAQIGALGRIRGCSIQDGCNATRSRSWMIGARYVFSPRTSVYATFNRTLNDANQRTDYVSSSVTSANPLPPGADPRIVAIGMIHNF